MCIAQRSDAAFRCPSRVSYRLIYEICVPFQPRLAWVRIGQSASRDCSASLCLRSTTEVLVFVARCVPVQQGASGAQLLNAVTSTSNCAVLCSFVRL